ncbi:uncharacterized protein LOC131543902 [Onychostoma macrolepis]|uniref:uncharacterized protein LOC131543902 n=1 Tax=Onychostoma macrolepis TaxID=369639 RepID=UPI00272ACAC6|nr:uncharacterized protein LOC131543902 [Onychostoma macrolepis]
MTQFTLNYIADLTDHLKTEMKGLNKYLFLLLVIFFVQEEATEKGAPVLDPSGGATVHEVTIEPSKEKAIEQGNVAIGRNAIQSSTHHTWDAGKAIDGIKDNWSKCSSTSYGNNPFWRLDLLNIYRVSRVVITNRIDCCPEHINGTEIRVGNSLENNGTDNPICAVISSIPAGVSYTYSCYGMVGRYVNLVIPGNEKVLILCEVEVYGTEFTLSRTFIKVKLHFSADLTDPATRDKLLEELKSALKFPDANLSWIRPPVETITEDAGGQGNQAIRTPSPVQGLTGDPGELTQVLGLASDCSAQSDCRGCWRNSTSVRRPGN